MKSICSLLSAFCVPLSVHPQAFPAQPAAAGHAILFSRHPRSISEVMESIKVSSTWRINSGLGELGLLWHGRSNFRIRDYRGAIEKPGDARSRLLTSAVYVAYTCNRPLDN
jgi:hypothetical protein